MSFYCKPPAGQVGLDVIRRAAFVRLKFLAEVSKCGRNLNKFRDLLKIPIFAQNANFIMEGTKLDCMAYFLLGFLTSGDSQMATYVTKAECRLFEFRIRLNSEFEILKSIKIASKFVATSCRDGGKEFAELVLIFRNLDQYGHGRLAKYLKNNYSNSLPQEQKIEKTLELPFTCVLRLVAERAVNLHKGMACVPVGSLLEVVLYIFETFTRINSARFQTLNDRLLLEDVRMKKLFEDLQAIIIVPEIHESNFKFESDVLTADLVDNVTEFFPPCMLHIHRQLRQKHRLKHNARIQYTLFLKELGMPLPEAVTFWANEYGRASCCGQQGPVNCNHDWSKDHRRYVYNLRHLYGLEGAKVNYSGHCCRALQSKIIQHGDDSGCPFRHFDSKHLKRFLMSEYGILDVQVWAALEDLLFSKQYCKACTLVLNNVAVKSRQNLMDVDRDVLSLPANHNFAVQADYSNTKVIRYCQSQPPPGCRNKQSSLFLTCYDHDLCKNGDEYCSEKDEIRVNVKKPSEFYSNSRLSQFY